MKFSVWFGIFDSNLLSKRETKPTKIDICGDENELS